VPNLILPLHSNGRNLMQIERDETTLSRWGTRCCWLQGKNQLSPGLSSKLSAKYFGPFTIAAAVGTRAFRLILPETVNIHHVFHVSQLKPYVSSSSSVTVTSPPPLYADKRGGVYEVEAIIAKKRVGKSWRYLVKWMGYDETENTWEPLAHVRHLADDVAAAPVLS